jgi:hypothetical protein
MSRAAITRAAAFGLAKDRLTTVTSATKAAVRMNSKRKPNRPRDEKFGAQAIRNIVSTNAIVTSLSTSVRLEGPSSSASKTRKTGAAGDRGSLENFSKDSRQFRRQ